MFVGKTYPREEHLNGFTAYSQTLDFIIMDQYLQYFLL